MKKVSIQDLKAQLSAAVAQAESGETILITSHNEPVARLAPVQLQHLHRGRLSGKEQILRAVKRGTEGRYLKILLEDRGDR